MVTIEERNEEPSGIVGSYRQENDVLFVNESADPLVDPSSSSYTPEAKSVNVRRVVILQNDRTLRSFRVYPLVKAERENKFVDEFETLLGHFFCVLCRLRFLSKTTFLRHLQSKHQTEHQLLLKRPSRSHVLFLMSDSSLAQGESEDSPTAGSLYERLFGAENSVPAPQLTPPANFTGMPFGFGNEKFSSGSRSFLGSTELNPDLYSQMFATVPHLANGTQMLAQRNSTKTLKCPRCNWHYKYQETLEIHMKEKHSEIEVTCIFCLQNQPHPKLARGESYSCGYKPYRCEVCKYSTTTKGNLSIHMQSDKHLHAMQELPNQIAPQTGVQTSELHSDQVLHCLICGNYATDCAVSMCEHLEADRGSSRVGDITMVNGFYYCHLCPYNTNLKANFQLHTRTDKHLQRVQLMNHLREGAANLTPATAICRLGTMKSVVQVRCRACQDILSCASSVREHCESRAHLTRLAYLTSVGSTGSRQSRASAHILNEVPLNPTEVSGVAATVVYECEECSFTTETVAEAYAHKSAVHPLSESDDSPLDCSTSRLPRGCDPETMREVAFYCKKCDFLSNTLEGLQNHEKAGDHNVKTAATDESCPHCVQKVTALRQHLLEEHNIGNEVADKLMTSSVASTSSINGAKDSMVGGVYRHRCPHCPLIFKHDEQLRMHEITHSYRISHKCPTCSKTFHSVSAVLQHQQEEHQNEEIRCEQCNVGFADRAELTAHNTGIDHLNRIKQQLQDQSSQQFQVSDKVLQFLQRRSPANLTSERNSSSPSKPFRCNVCAQSYSQGSTLDIHLRSVGHQTRMNRLNELVANGEIDSQRPVSEQPGGLPQKKIAELIDSEATSHATMTNENPLALLNAFNVAQFLQLAQPSADTNDDPADPRALNALGESETSESTDFFSAAQLNEATEGGLDLTTLFQDSKLTVESQKRKSEQRPGAELRRALEGYGLDLVAQIAGDFDTRKIEFVAAEKAADLRQQFREITGDSASVEAIQAFAENLRAACDLVPDEALNGDQKTSIAEENDPSTSPPAAKRHRSSDSTKSSTSSTPRPRTSGMNQEELMSLMGNMPFANSNQQFMSPEVLQAAFASMLPAFSMPNSSNGVASSVDSMATRNDSSPQKRARTRITDDQLKVLRQYFDINNSPTEQQVKEMSTKTDLPEKVIKHWFRNTLFKERQRDKNSPYNFNVPAMMRIDLDTYEKTGEARIIPLKQEGDSEEVEDEETTIRDVSTKATSSTNDNEIDNRASSPSNSSTHSSTATPAATAETQNLGPDLVANFNKAMAAAAAGMNVFGSSTDYSTANQSNPFAALFNSQSMNVDENPFAQMLQGFAVASNGNQTAASTAANLNRPVISASQTSTAGGSGRRANRTRFTDFQLRTLQEFFERQAYPKDDDLEMLSKKLSLTPRIITVWFQNARQKARKVYENQPTGDQNERFIRTPGSNFQCKRCQLVFQRYYELIQHQQRVCYVNDGDAQQTDNRSLDDRLDPEERERRPKMEDDGVNGVDENTTSSDANTDNNNSTHDLLQLLTKSNGDALLKMVNRTENKFSKRCPFCGFLGESRELLQEHFTSKHSDNVLVNAIDVDALPDEETSGGLASTTEELLGKISALTGGTSPLDLRLGASANFPWDSSNQNDGNRSTSSPTLSEDADGSRGPENFDDFSSSGNFDLRALSTSPGALLSAFGSPLSAAFNGSANSLQSQQRGSNNANSSGGSSKRYRTHLTPLQVFVMKSLFVDYKTPSMGECEILGREIGLHKRVVQVWNQNARAKIRKCGMESIMEDGLCSTAESGCEMCGVEFNGRTTVQDHIFTLMHINKVKERGAALRGTGGEENSQCTQPMNENRSARSSSGRVRQSNSGVGEDLQFNPLNLVYSTLLDPNVVGTPIRMLQIPEAVMNQIASDLRDGQTATKFTQDGRELSELASVVESEDFRCAQTTESEVGWGCPQCSNIFQQESLLRNHQKFICTGCEGTFRLIQRHYECSACAIKFGTQNDFKAHCEEATHRSNRSMEFPPQLFPALSTATSSGATC
ncbi:hypothetical protein M3Y94_00589800 [Aphelenchoides besseyi]|nr:hypothetical protein M3Y94_00589800 [Aphelenchoides besseyi]